jgi:hypothetical protein
MVQINKKPLSDLAVRQGQIGDWEFATLSFPGWHSARIGCQLPDAILHGKRSSFGLIAGPSSALRPLNFE